MVNPKGVYIEKSRVINTYKGMPLTSIVDINWLALTNTNGMSR